MLHPAFRWLGASPRRIGSAVVLLLMGGVGFLPLFGGPGYEHALASGLVVPSTAAIAAALEASRERRAPAAQLAKGASTGAVFALVSLGTALAHGLRAGFCDVVGGVLGYVLTAGIGAVMGGLWGAVVGEFARGARRRRTAAVLFALAGPLGTVGAGLLRFWSSPMIFAYDPFFGFFSGTLYDTVVDPGIGLLTYRTASAATFAGALLLSSGLERGEGSALVLARERPARWRALAGSALLAASLASVAFGDRLDHWHTSGTIARDLGGRRSGPRCDVVYPDTLREDDAALLLRDCEEQLAEVEARLGAKGPPRVVAFFFRDGADKRRLMGAEHTYIAKPWRGEVYLQYERYPHPVLGHELAHVVAGSFGQGPFRVAGAYGGLLPNPGLIEGVAVAASPDEDALTDLEWARAMRDRALLPPMTQIFSLGFLGGSAQKSYTVAGAFVRWLMDTRGAAAVRRWYGGEPVEMATGRSLAELDAEFRAALDAVPLLPEADAYVKARFDRPGIFGRACPHVVDALRRRADGCRDANQVEQARNFYDEVLRRDPNDFGARLSLASMEARVGDMPRGAAALAQLAADEALPRTVRDRAEDLRGDLALLEGRWEDAAALFDALAARTADEDAARQYEVKAIGARDPAAREAVVALLVGARDRGPDAWLGASKLGAWGSPLADYLIGKNVVAHGLYADAAPYLARAAVAPPATARIGRELFRQQAIVACARGDRAEADRLAARLRAPDGPFPAGVSSGRREHVERLLARCARAPG
jgi:tetratricopeptide (TPR) repeat protein